MNRWRQTAATRGSPLLALLLACGCTGQPARRQEPAILPVRALLPANPEAAPRGIVLCVPGAGGFPSICRITSEAVAEQGIPVAVELFEWNHGHGYGNIVTDHVDYGNIHTQGQRLAWRICALRQQCPGQPIFVLSHSAGCAVSLEAACWLPPDSVERMVLLAPAVSATYDLRPALAVCRRGVDAFYSGRDWAALGLGTALIGTADRRWSAAAGRVGFRPLPGCPGGQALYARLRQYPWNCCVAWAGNAGGHYGAYQPAFLRAYVLPLLRPDNDS